MAVKAKVDRLGSRPRFSDLGEDGVLELLLGRLGPGLLALGLLQAAGGEHRLQALGALARLRRVGLVDDDGEALAPAARRSASAMTGNFCRVVTMIVLPASSASLSWREVVSMFSTTPRVCSNWRMVRCSWRSSTRRSVMTTIESNTRRSRGSCRVESWWASQAMVKLLPLPAECWIEVALARRRARGHGAPGGARRRAGGSAGRSAAACRSCLALPSSSVFYLVDELAHQVEHAVARPHPVATGSRWRSPGRVGGTAGLPAPPKLAAG